MKKHIIAVSLLVSSLAADSYLMLSGLAYHNKNENSLGRKYDVFIEGAGYQYRQDCMALECSYTALLINDSNSNFQPIACILENMRKNIGIIRYNINCIGSLRFHIVI